MKPCRYILNGEECPYDKKCRFLHEDSKKTVSTAHNEKEEAGQFSDNQRLAASERTKEKQIKISVAQSASSEEQLKHKEHPNKQNSKVSGTKANTNCHFFLHSHCKYGEKCKYLHPHRVQFKDKTKESPGSKQEKKERFPTDKVRPTDSRAKVDSRSTDLRSTDSRSTDLKSTSDKVRSTDSRSTTDSRPTDLRSTSDKVRSTDSRSKVKSTDSRSTDSRSTDLRSTDSRSTDLRYTDSRSTDSRSTDLKYTDSRSTDLRSTDSRPTDLRSTTDKVRSTDSRSKVKSTDSRSTDSRPTDSRPTDLRSTTDKVRSTDSRSTDSRSTNSRSTDLRSTDLRRSNKNQTFHNPPPPLTLASFIGEISQKPYPKPQKQKETSCDNLRELEMEQLQKRFPGEACSLLRKSHDKITYLIHFSPTDQDWHGPNVVLLEVTFPENYPKDYCLVELSSGQELSSEAISRGNEAMKEYWNPEMLGGLMFRPFLRWWDRNMVQILQPFLPETADQSNEEAEEAVEEIAEDKSECVQPVVRSKRGTEIRFVGLDTSQTLGTAFWTAFKIVLSCSRCKNHQEVEVKEERLYSVSCSRCNSTFSIIYHLALIHSTSSTIGYLELTSCTPVEVIFQSSFLSVTCLDCSSEVNSQGFFIGQPKDVYCQRCHNKITIYATAVKFFKHQQSDSISATRSVSVSVVPSSRKNTETFIKDGYPLPETGVCQHYKKSHRWLRFPCCGRAFPCDVCHDSVQDHSMERATRMLYGFCSKEQTYTGKGCCIRCGADLTSSRHSAHWEGGQGCRNRTKMSRLDKHKYKNSNSKTTCLKMQRVGKTNSSNK